jgi:hypothetical protein
MTARKAYAVDSTQHLLTLVRSIKQLYNRREKMTGILTKYRSERPDIDKSADDVSNAMVALS